MATSSTPSATAASAAHHGYFADLYTFDWSHFAYRLPLICSLAIAICLVGGVLAGHPSAGLIAGGGAMTIGFGINQRIADSRLWPMIAATIVMFLSTMVGMVAGHRGLSLLAVAAIWSFLYGLLTARAAGISWVGQQAAVTLLVTSAFPADLRHAFHRGLLILLGGGMQILITSIALRKLPQLRSHILDLPYAGGVSVNHLLEVDDPTHVSLYTPFHQLRAIPRALPKLSTASSFGYAVRLMLTVTLAAEIYRRLGLQSGYWVPMTALLVQKPAFHETLNRALMRITGTLAGAVFSTLFLAHVHPDLLVLAVLATLCALGSYATNTVNYGLFTLFLTSYIVFLLSLNAMPGPLIARHRALCTITGGLVALVIHLEDLFRHRRSAST
ncbi:MAG TPA: FUSC family protein [Granulicella sp.]